MKDILAVITEKESQIEQLQEDIAALKRAAKILGLQNNNGSPTTATQEVENSTRPRFGPGRWPIPIGDAAEQVLVKTGHSLHLDDIHKAIRKVGVDPPRTSLDSALRKDPKERFALVGKRTYDLKKR